MYVKRTPKEVEYDIEIGLYCDMRNVTDVYIHVDENNFVTQIAKVSFDEQIQNFQN